MNFPNYVYFIFLLVLLLSVRHCYPRKTDFFSLFFFPVCFFIFIYVNAVSGLLYILEINKLHGVMAALGIGIGLGLGGWLVACDPILLEEHPRFHALKYKLPFASFNIAKILYGLIFFKINLPADKRMGAIILMIFSYEFFVYYQLSFCSIISSSLLFLESNLFMQHCISGLLLGRALGRAMKSYPLIIKRL